MVTDLVMTLMQRDLCDLGSQILIWNLVKERTLKFPIKTNLGLLLNRWLKINRDNSRAVKNSDQQKEEKLSLALPFHWIKIFTCDTDHYSLFNNIYNHTRVLMSTQEHINWNSHIPYKPLETSFARIFSSFENLTRGCSVLANRSKWNYCVTTLCHTRLRETFIEWRQSNFWLWYSRGRGENRVFRGNFEN